ncbi:unnamed protein product, partial [Polarella glacialis]
MGDARGIRVDVSVGADVGVAADRRSGTSLRNAKNTAAVRMFLLCACLAEAFLLVPNFIIELQMDKGLYAPILRLLLAFVRLAPLGKPWLSKMGRCGATITYCLDDILPALYGPACGGVEICRGLATALSGWYLISTPMHAAFSPRGDSISGSGSGETQSKGISGQQVTELQPELVLPCAVIMSANVALFLCDALALTLTPLLRMPDHRQTMPVLPEHPRAEAFVFGEPQDAET